MKKLRKLQLLQLILDKAGDLLNMYDDTIPETFFKCWSKKEKKKLVYDYRTYNHSLDDEDEDGMEAEDLCLFQIANMFYFKLCEKLEKIRGADESKKSSQE